MPILTEAIPRQGTSASANYDFRDLTAGLGYDTLYGVATEPPGGSVSYIASPIADLFSNKTFTTTTATPTTLTLDFDTSEFNLPRTVLGRAIINFAYGTTTVGANVSFSAQIFKVAADGTTTTALTSKETWTHSGLAVASYEFLQFMDMTENRIKKEEKIRVELIIDVTNNAACRIYHDSTGQTNLGTGYSAIAKFLIPFKIDQ